MALMAMQKYVMSNVFEELHFIANHSEISAHFNEKQWITIQR
jgi:hypothetical protein